MRYTVQRKRHKDSDWRDAASEFKSANKIVDLIHTIGDAQADKHDGNIFDWQVEDSLRETVLSSEQVLQILYNPKEKNATV